MNKTSTIKLKPLNKSNWEACASLKVHAQQEDALPDNLFSIAQLNFYPQTKAVAILNKDEEIVGFATFGPVEDEDAFRIFRFMIDKRHQGKGYGKAALSQIVKEIFADNNLAEIQACYHPQRNELKIFYEAVGFKEKGVISCERRKEGKMLAILARGDFKF